MPRLGRPASPTGGHIFRPEDKDELDFSEPTILFYAQESTT